MTNVADNINAAFNVGMRGSLMTIKNKKVSVSTNMILDLYTKLRVARTSIEKSVQNHI